MQGRVSLSIMYILVAAVALWCLQQHGNQILQHQLVVPTMDKSAHRFVKITWHSHTQLHIFLTEA